MKHLLTFTLGIALVAASGCSDAESDDSAVTAPAPAPAGVEIGASAAPSAPQAAGQSGEATAAAPAEAVQPQLAPIQSAIQTFEVQNKRMPVNVHELVESGAIKSLPELPTGQIYYIDHATKQIKIGGGP